MTPPTKVRPRAKLVVHDLGIEAVPQANGPDKLLACVECERHHCQLSVDECRACERFERIESHEAGYVVLCRSQDEPFDTSE